MYSFRSVSPKPGIREIVHPVDLPPEFASRMLPRGLETSALAQSSCKFIFRPACFIRDIAKRTTVHADQPNSPDVPSHDGLLRHQDMTAEP